MPTSNPRSGKHGDKDSPNLPVRSRASNNDSPNPTKNGAKDPRSPHSAGVKGGPGSRSTGDVGNPTGSPKEKAGMKSPRAAEDTSSPSSQSKGGSSGRESPSTRSSSPPSAGLDKAMPRSSKDGENEGTFSQAHSGKRSLKDVGCESRYVENVA